MEKQSYQLLGVGERKVGHHREKAHYIPVFRVRGSRGEGREERAGSKDFFKKEKVEGDPCWPKTSGNACVRTVNIEIGVHYFWLGGVPCSASRRVRQWRGGQNSRKRYPRPCDGFLTSGKEKRSLGGFRVRPNKRWG